MSVCSSVLKLLSPVLWKFIRVGFTRFTSQLISIWEKNLVILPFAFIGITINFNLGKIKNDALVPLIVVNVQINPLIFFF